MPEQKNCGLSPDASAFINLENAMQVFLSWSGERSKAVAETLASWISQVIQAVEPWISSDIEKGVRWNPEISARLEQSKVGVVCLTKENVDSRWILFEAGALSKTKDAYVCTLLLDLAPTDVEQPLGQFQHTTRDKNDIRQLLRTINKAVQKTGERSLADSVLDDVFETYWPRLADSLEGIASQKPTTEPAHRTEREVLQEILEIVRGQERRIAAVEENQLRKDLFSRDLLLREAMRSGVDPSKGDLENLLSSSNNNTNYLRRLLLSKLVNTERPTNPRDQEERGET